MSNESLRILDPIPAWEVEGNYDDYDGDDDDIDAYQPEHGDLEIWIQEDFVATTDEDEDPGQADAMVLKQYCQRALKEESESREKHHWQVKKLLDWDDCNPVERVFNTEGTIFCLYHVPVVFVLLKE